MSGLIGKKIGMTSIFDENGKNIPCTVIEAGPCVVTQVRTKGVDGYEALQLGFDDKNEKHSSKAAVGHFKKAGTVAKKKVVEFQGFETEQKLGDVIDVSIFEEGELLKDSVVRKFRTTAADGKNYNVEHYNLDMIISLGYRVNSKRATSFRVWATKILKDYIINGYSINNKRLQQKGLKELNEAISLLKDTISNAQIELNEAKGLLDVILNYSRT